MGPLSNRHRDCCFNFWKRRFRSFWAHAPLQQLENPRDKSSHPDHFCGWQILGKFFYNDNRTPINFDELPEHLVQALVATEDERFYSHSGIDFRGTFRAIAYLGRRGGASTITQQLARQLFVENNARATKFRPSPKKLRVGLGSNARAALHKARDHCNVSQHL